MLMQIQKHEAVGSQKLSVKNTCTQFCLHSGVNMNYLASSLLLVCLQLVVCFLHAYIELCRQHTFVC